MNPTIQCVNCGLRFAVPEQYGRARRVRCPKCDSVCEVKAAAAPAPMQVEEETPACPECGGTMQVTPGKLPRCNQCEPIRKPKVQSEAIRTLAAKPARVSVSPPPPVSVVPDSRIAGTHDEEDDRPYPVPADPRQKEPCPHCQQSVLLGTVVCNHCGFNRETATVIQRVYGKVAKRWDAGLAPHVRLGVFLLFIAGASLLAMVNLANLEGSAAKVLLAWLFGIGVPAFILGTYPRLDLTRSKKGQVKLTKTWRFCFLPWNPITIDWRGHEGVIVTRFHSVGFSDWLVPIFLVVWDLVSLLMFGLILPIGVLGAIAWWFCIIQVDQFDVALTKDHGSPSLILYRGRNEEMAKDIAGNLRNVTGMP